MIQPSDAREICAHLRPLADAILAAGIDFAKTASPYGGDASWWRCGCTFVESTLRERLALDACVEYCEYNGMAAGSDATFSCREHEIVFMGPHPAWAAKGTPCLR